MCLVTDRCISAFPRTKVHTVFLAPAEKATTEQLKMFQAWNELLKAVTRREADEGKPGLFANIDMVAPAPRIIRACVEAIQRCNIDLQEPTFEWPKRDLLNVDQHWAHDIMERQLKK